MQDKRFLKNLSPSKKIQKTAVYTQKAALIFLSLPFSKKARKITDKARTLYSGRTPKILGKEKSKSTQKSKEFLEKRKSKEIQKSKEKKIRAMKTEV